MDGRKDRGQERNELTIKMGKDGEGDSRRRNAVEGEGRGNEVGRGMGHVNPEAYPNIVQRQMYRWMIAH